MRNPDEHQDLLAMKLRKFRQAAGFSQRNVAESLRINRSTYSYYELGKTMPDVSTLNRIANIFGVPVEEFFASEEEGSSFRDVRDTQAEKQIYDNPSHIEQLSQDERLLIALLRSTTLFSAKETVVSLMEELEIRKDQGND